MSIIDCNYSVVGSGPAIFFTHGVGGAEDAWRFITPKLKDKFTIVTYDLRGHGNSKGLTLNPFQSKYTFKVITDDIINVLNHEKILKSHFVGISLGTILIRKLADFIPERVITMTMAGAIIKLNFRSRILMYFGNFTKSFLPYMWIYRLFALVLMSASTNILTSASGHTTVPISLPSKTAPPFCNAKSLW